MSDDARPVLYCILETVMTTDGLPADICRAQHDRDVVVRVAGDRLESALGNHPAAADLLRHIGRDDLVHAYGIRRY